MANLIDLCEHLFGTRDIYELFGVSRNASPNKVKIAFYKIALEVHPDRVPPEEKEQATAKYTVLTKLHQVLCDMNKRMLYDEQGFADDCEYNECKLSSWLELWKDIFTKLNAEEFQLDNHEYIGSGMKQSEIRKAFLMGKRYIFEVLFELPYIRFEGESRWRAFVKELHSLDKVQHYKFFRMLHKVKGGRVVKR